MAHSMAMATDDEGQMKLSILKRTSDYRGDHAADITIAVEPRAELVTELVQRLKLDPKDWIEIRVIQDETTKNTDT